jgi:hypothetical protein
MGWISRQDGLAATAEMPFYETPTPQAPPRAPQPQRPLTVTRPELKHIWREGDTIKDVALKYDQDPEEILDLNLIEEEDIQPGDLIKIPSKKYVRKTMSIRYEAFDRPVIMHVNNPNGIQKFAFANVRTADDPKGSGHFPHGTEIQIHGIAQVPLEEGESLAYYMDGHAFGSFKENGKISWNIGYAWSELSEGKFMVPEPPALTILEEPETHDISMFDEEPEEVPEPVTEAAQPAIEVDPYRDSFEPLTEDAVPQKFLYEADIELHEANGRKHGIARRKLDPVLIIGTFEFRGERVYQPGRSVDEMLNSGLWWPIPMDAIILEDDVFSFAQRRKITRQERYWQFVSRVAAKYTKLEQYIKQKIN